MSAYEADIGSLPAVVFEASPRNEPIERLQDIQEHGNEEQLRYALEAVLEALEDIDATEPIVFREQVVGYLLDKQ